MSWRVNHSSEPWTEAEDRKLLDENFKQVRLDAIAFAHGRSEIAIKCRLLKHAREAMDLNGYSLKDSSLEFRVDAKELKEFVSREEKRTGNLEELLTEVRDLLKKLLESKNS